MGQEVRRLLQKLGSTRAHRLPFRGYLAWVLTSWGPSWGEATAGHPSIEDEQEEYNWKHKREVPKQDRNGTENTWVDRNQRKMNMTVHRNERQENRLESSLSGDNESNLEDGERTTKDSEEKGRKRVPWHHNMVPMELWVEDKLSYIEYTSPVYLEVVIPLVERGKLLHHIYCDFLN